jgi:hypothetical protein
MSVKVYEDERFGAQTNSVLEELTHYLIDAGHRLSVSQHSQIMKRVERAVLAEVEDDRALLAIWVRGFMKLEALADHIESGAWKNELKSSGLREGSGVAVDAHERTRQMNAIPCPHACMSPCSTCENSALAKELRALRIVADAAHAVANASRGPLQSELSALRRALADARDHSWHEGSARG